MRNLYPVIIVLFLFSGAKAQEHKATLPGVPDHVLTSDHAPLMEQELHGETGFHASNQKWASKFTRVMERSHGQSELQAIKEKKRQQKLKAGRYGLTETKGTEAVEPEIGINYEANWMVNGTPPDNSMAISNGGYVVTLNNDGIEIYDAQHSLQLTEFWSDYFNDPSLTDVLYDPLVTYDSGLDRFFMVVLHGSSSTTSEVLTCFSKSNNPLDGWWIYKLPGNPQSIDQWFDYPNIGVSTNEVYITGNLFNNAGNFQETVVFQIGKLEGFNGQNINYRRWVGMTSTEFDPFTLVPASYGHSGNYGPGIYMVSTSASGSDKILLWDLTDDATGNPELLSYTMDAVAYSVGAQAEQKGSSDLLDNGDCRIQNAFYLNGLLHFAFATDVENGWNGIYYGRMELNTGSVQAKKFHLAGTYDYCYPAVASFSTNASDPAVMIAFLRSSGAIYPEVRVVNCDANMNFSPSVQVKAGESPVDLADGDERWGDYSGISRKHNAPEPEIWLAGSYGADLPGFGVEDIYKTWVAQVKAGETISVDENIVAERKTKVFPNPVVDLFTLETHVTNRVPYKITLVDQQGKVVRLLFDGIPRVGTNRLQFNKGVLSPGVYTVQIMVDKKVLEYAQVVVD